jgi:hypothetical protein
MTFEHLTLYFKGRRRTMKTINLFLLILVAGISGCATIQNPGTTENVAAHQAVEKERTFNLPYHEVWGGVISSVAGCAWETEFIEKEAGIIKFKTSYVFSDLTKLHRMYVWPREFEAKEFWPLDNYLKKYTFYKRSSILDGGSYILSTENLIIRVRKVNEENTKVETDWKVSAFARVSGQVDLQSNGLHEKEILDDIETTIGKVKTGRGKVGIGFKNENRDGSSYPVVQEVIENSPAQKAGLQKGDVVLEVDGKSTRGMSILEVLQTVTGEPETSVNLKVERSGKSFDVSVTRKEGL